MTRPLVVVDASDRDAVIDALMHALSGDGPAVLPHAGAPAGLPSIVAQRVAVVVETSGSTAKPKRVALSADALLASAAASESRLGGPGQWLLALPAHYIAGVAVLVRSLAAQTHPVTLPSDSFSVEGFVEAAAQLTGARRFTSLVPAQLSRLLAYPDALEPLRRFDGILVGGQATPADLAAQAVEAGLTVIRTYGSSETAGGCVYDGVPIGDAVVEIVDGRVELGGGMLAEGYLDDESRTAAAFVERNGRRWFRTDDTGLVHGGVLAVTGRVDDVIISGGVKVSLAEVEAVVRALPGMAGAVVVGAPSAQWGDAPIVVSTLAIPIGELRDAVASSLGRAAAPASILVVDAVPMLPSGKPDRLRIAALARD